MNSVNLIGRLTRDPEKRATPGGTDVCTMRLAIQRALSGERPPPGTTQWTWGWCVSACPQVWRTATTPIPAPSRRGLAASVDIASAAALNRIA